VRIVKVAFANLNSLYGTWEIDFSHPAYIHDGIFAITGPTGAGKSTILDAICLALYGRTPRLDSVGGQSNEIMSRHTAHCFAEVTFETAQGRFRCTWRQRRARNHIDGNLVASEHEFIDAATDTIICNKKREVATAVESSTGMNFERFTRSMLLAQGQFAAFLTCDADQRAPILEQITGTEIYSRISQTVHERKREEELRLQQLHQQAQSLQPLTEDAVAQLTGKLSLMHRWEQLLTLRIAAIRTASSTLEQQRALGETLERLQQKSAQMNDEQSSMDATRKQYERAMQALELESRYQKLEELRKVQQEDQALLKREQQLLNKCREQAGQAEHDHKEAAERVSEAQRSRDEAQPALRYAREVSQHLATLIARADTARVQLAEQIKQRRAHISERIALQQVLNKQYRQLNEKAQWIAEHQVDSRLEEVLPDVQMAVHAVKQAEQELQEQESLLLSARKMTIAKQHDYEVASARCLEQEKAVQECENKLNERQVIRDRLLEGGTKASLQREYRLVHEQQLLQARIASLTEHRNHLVDGKPCPLCGAIEHPWAHTSLPTSEDTEHHVQQLQKLLDRVEQEELQVQKLKEKQSEVLYDQHMAQSLRDQLLQQKDEAVKQEAEIQAAQDAAKEQWDKQKEALQKLLTPYGFAQSPADPYTQLHQRLQTFRDAEKAGEHMQVSIRQDEQQFNSLHNTLLSEQQHIQNLRETLGEQRQACGRDEKLLKELLGDQSADELQQSLDIKLAEMQKEMEALKGTWETVNRELALHLHSADAVEKRIAEQGERLPYQEQEFLQLLNGQGFSDEPDFLHARCLPDERAQMKEELAAWEAKKRSYEVRITETQRNLDAVSVEHLACWDRESLRQAADRSELQIRDIHQQMGAIQQQLDHYEDQQALYSDHLLRVEQQKQVFHGWDRLNMLIGSHDGKKFRNFAQSLTFELLITHANEHLNTFIDRYLLIADTNKVLDISVVDLYQAGEVRSAKNLSGGESFLVSLALALALSTIASKRVQVDSLFLDEGFGTLDEQTLETALTALSTLRSRGKLVGIISHVGALQERIPVQLSVIPISGGVSRIEGPGCVGRS